MTTPSPDLCPGAPMNEVEWESCADPQTMLSQLLDEGSDRKLRLLACAAWRWRYTRSARWLLRQTVSGGMLRLLAGERATLTGWASHWRGAGGPPSPLRCPAPGKP